MLKEKLFERLHKQPFGTTEVISTYKIVIPEEFKKRESKPAKWKMIRARKEYHKRGFLDKPIMISKDYILKDCYTRYIVATELGLKVVPVCYEE
jgi:hypothetical protein